MRSPEQLEGSARKLDKATAASAIIALGSLVVEGLTDIIPDEAVLSIFLSSGAMAWACAVFARDVRRWADFDPNPTPGESEI